MALASSAIVKLEQWPSVLRMLNCVGVMPASDK